MLKSDTFVALDHASLYLSFLWLGVYAHTLN